MADEVKPPDPGSPPPEGVQVSPPSTGKEEAAPAGAGEKKAPNKMIIAAAGGAAAVVVVILLIMLMVSCLSTSYSVPGVSPDLSEPKKAGESYLKFRWDKQWNQTEMGQKYGDEDASYEDTMADFYEDKDEYKKQKAKAKAETEAWKKNKKEFAKWKELKWDSDEGTDERKTLKYTIEYKRLVRTSPEKADEGDKPEHYKVDDAKGSGVLVLAKLGGKWRLVSAQGYLCEDRGRREGRPD